MKAIGASGQTGPHRLYTLDGKIAVGSTSQLVTPIPFSRSFALFQNTSSAPMYLEFGSARATATISGGAVSAVTITNGGFGFTAPPVIEFMGGAAYNPRIAVGPSGCGLPGYASPSNVPNNLGGRPAKARCVLTAGVVTSITIDDPGAGYAIAPYMDISNPHSDRYGAADPYYGSVNSGQYVPGGGSYYINGTVCDTEQWSVWCATINSTYLFRWMP